MAVAAAASLQPVGVDVEHWDTFPPALLQNAQVFHVEERTALAACNVLSRPQAMARLWTHKEALIKLGEVQLDTLHHVNLAASVAHVWPPSGKMAGRYTAAQWQDDPHRLVGTVLVIGRSPVTLTVIASSNR
nr:4'-phosphopantetheinyl transferase family protein [Deinococcus betulae]